jgi:hypothetical protein
MFWKKSVLAYFKVRYRHSSDFLAVASFSALSVPTAVFQHLVETMKNFWIISF